MDASPSREQTGDPLSQRIHTGELAGRHTGWCLGGVGGGGGKEEVGMKEVDEVEKRQEEKKMKKITELNKKSLGRSSLRI